MKSGKTGERRFGRLGVASERRANIVDRLAKRHRLRQEIGGKIRVFGHTLPQPVGLFDRQRFRVPQPLDDVSGLAKMVLMRGKTAAGFGVGKVEREIVGDQRPASQRERGELGAV